MDLSGSRRLGRSNLQVSPLGLGCWPIGGAMAAGDQPLGYTGVDDAESRRALARAADLGVTLFDTADAYGAGHSERLLGETFGNRPEILIATKFGNTIDEGRRQLTGEDSSPSYVRQAVHASLRRLRREAIDLYQLHTPPGGAQQTEDLLAALEDLVDQGLVRWYGISSDDPDAATAFAAGAHCTAVQLELNVLGGRSAAVEVCERHDLAALGRSPLAMGLLSGRYSDGATRLPADDVRGTQPDWMKWFADGAPVGRFLQQIDSVRDLLTADGRSLVQGALAWSWAASPLSIPLPGFRTVAHVESTAAAMAQGPLSGEQWAVVEAALDRPVAARR
jgi:aryl-alcohol dehydrogenase-like predicted oxidoreductase